MLGWNKISPSKLSSFFVTLTTDPYPRFSSEAALCVRTSLKPSKSFSGMLSRYLNRRAKFSEIGSHDEIGKQLR